MALTRAEVEHVAKLARMQLESDELERMRSQLSAILEYVDMLSEVDVAGVPITSQVTGLLNVMRADEPRPSLPQSDALANSPDREAGFFRTKAVFEE